MNDGAELAADGRPRCPWATQTDDLLVYHDEEWGRPVRGDRGLYERMVLEAFQSGLSWLTILRKRSAFRAAFVDFDPERVAAYDERDVERLLSDAGIIRNRMKIEAAITNARAVLDQPEPLSTLLWGFAPDEPAVPWRVSDVPATTEVSKAMAKELKRRGFRFVGPTTCYALMQAAGLVNDHLADCVAREPTDRARRTVDAGVDGAAGVNGAVADSGQ